MKFENTEVFRTFVLSKCVQNLDVPAEGFDIIFAFIKEEFDEFVESVGADKVDREKCIQILSEAIKKSFAFGEFINDLLDE